MVLAIREYGAGVTRPVWELGYGYEAGMENWVTVVQHQQLNPLTILASLP